MAEAVLIGSIRDREAFYPAITHLDMNKGRVTYDYGLLVECFAKEFMRWNNDKPGYDKESALTDATEWIDCNVMRSLPYMGKHAPKVK